VAHELAHEFVFSESRCKKTLINQGFNYNNWWSCAPSPLICYSLNSKACGFWGGSFYPYFYP